MRRGIVSLVLTALALAGCDSDQPPEISAPGPDPVFDRAATAGLEDAPFRNRAPVTVQDFSPESKLLARHFASSRPSRGGHVGTASSHYKMAYDMSHDDGRQQLGWDNYGTLRTALSAVGVTVEQITDFSLSTLQNYDVLWLEEEFGAALGEGEVLTLIRYLLGGGAVVICCEDWGTGPTSPATVLGFPYVEVGGPEGTSTDITLHPVTFRVSSVYFPGHDMSFDVPPWGLSLVRNGEAHAIASSFGRIVAMADEVCFDERIVQENNQRLCTQAISYLNLFQPPAPEG